MRSSRRSAKRSARARRQRKSGSTEPRTTSRCRVENFCKWVKEYLDSKGPQHRIVFLVDEVGQFIGTDSHLMLNLQTITEELGTICRRRAWVVVTSQEDMDTVLGDMSKTKKQDFSKIQGRFFPPLSLSSANVDEVIQSRLLAKLPDVKGELEAVFKQKGDILKNQLTFKNCGMTFRQFKDGEDFVKNYPFAPYQFQLIQKIFEAIRKAGATGMHLARGERSMLDAFQSAAKTVSINEVGVLVPLYDFYPSIESFLDTSVKKTIDQAETNPSLEPFDIQLAPGSLPHPLCGRDEGQRGQPRDPLPGPDRRRPAGPAPPDRGEPGPAGKGNAHQPQRRQLLLPDQRRTGHQQGDQAGRSVERRGSQAPGRDHLRRRAEGAAQAPLQRQQDGLRLQPPLRPVPHRQPEGRGACSSRSSRRWPTTTKSTTRASASSKAVPRAATS